jgi:hypothetical protein
MSHSMASSPLRGGRRTCNTIVLIPWLTNPGGLTHNDESMARTRLGNKRARLNNESNLTQKSFQSRSRDRPPRQATTQFYPGRDHRGDSARSLRGGSVPVEAEHIFLYFAQHERCHTRNTC